MSRDCDAIGCSCATASGRFMCRKHWFMVPAELQRVINTRYRACRKDYGFLSDPEYLKACTVAIQGIARAEGKPAADDSYARLLRGVEKRAANNNAMEDSTCSHCGEPVLPGQAYNGATKNHWDCDPRKTISTQAVIDQMDTAINKARNAVSKLTKQGSR